MECFSIGLPTCFTCSVWINFKYHIFCHRIISIKILLRPVFINIAERTNINIISIQNSMVDGHACYLNACSAFCVLPRCRSSDFETKKNGYKLIDETMATIKMEFGQSSYRLGDLQRLHQMVEY